MQFAIETLQGIDNKLGKYVVTGELVNSAGLLPKHVASIEFAKLLGVPIESDIEDAAEGIAAMQTGWPMCGRGRRGL